VEIWAALKKKLAVEKETIEADGLNFVGWEILGREECVKNKFKNYYIKFLYYKLNLKIFIFL